jgi:hypothetical protein
MMAGVGPFAVPLAMANHNSDSSITVHANGNLPYFRKYVCIFMYVSSYLCMRRSESRVIPIFGVEQEAESLWEIFAVL